MPLHPIALPPALPSELLTYILTHSAHSTTLIICKPRQVSLTSLANSTAPPSAIPPEAPSSPPHETFISSQDNPPEAAPPPPPPRHTLLIPTLHQIAASRNIKLVFVPTVSHLRAWLAVFPPPDTGQEVPKQEFDKKGKRDSLLVIFGLVELHRDGSEWSTQGLGNTIAGLVEAGGRGGRRVVAVEGRSVDVEDRMEGMEEGGGREGNREEHKGNVWSTWNERVPMLNGSGRRVGLDSKDGAWVGRTVEVGRILGRWFKFGGAEWASHV